MVSFKTDISDYGNNYSITVETDQKSYFEALQDMARAMIDGKDVSVTVADKIEPNTLFVGEVVKE